MPEPSPRGAPSRQEMADTAGEGPMVCSQVMIVGAVTASVLQPGHYRVDLFGPNGVADAIVMAPFAEPPRVGQRMRVALFDLEDGE
jgi:hypothetical protein